ncbi:MAG TPA: glycosyltransferase 87 family protein [Candidatus Limnocylindria bacterium]|nr:glycosyltransferase 87 family protein [Candidatus Limnocylindria bacterium]
MIATYGPLAGVLALALPLLWPADYPGDHFTFWAAGHIVAVGRSPYDARAWTDSAIDAAAAGGLVVDMRPVLARNFAVIWTYPPWTAVALAPFGALPVSVGVPLFHFTSLAAAVLAAVALARSLPWRDPPQYALALVLFALYEPFILGVRGGHFVGVLLAGVCLVQIGVLRNRVWPLVAGALLLSLKPPAVLALAVVVLGILLLRRRWSQIAWTTGTLAAIAAISVVAYPDSLAAIAAGFAERATVQGATTWTLVAGILGAPSGGVVAGLQLALVVGCVLSVCLAPRPFKIHAIVAVTLVAGLALVPYANDHDQLLLIPALVLAVHYDDLAVRGRRWYLALICVTFVVAPWLIEVPTVIAGAPSFAGAVPFLAGITVLVGTAVVRAKRRAATGRPSS